MPSGLETILNWVLTTANVGVWGVAAFVARWLWNRWRWIQFRRSVRRVGSLEEDIMPEDLRLRDWKVLAAMTLSDAEFTPSECLKLLDLATHVAVGEAAVSFRWFRDRKDEQAKEK